MKIFLVEDDPFFAQLMSDHLAKNKMYEVSVFTSGEACLAQIFENPTVVILDYHLDSVSKGSDNGMAVLEKIKKTHPHIHVVVLSGQQHYGVAAQTIAKGAEQYVMKDDEAFNNIDMILQDFSKVS